MRVESRELETLCSMGSQTLEPQPCKGPTLELFRNPSLNSELSTRRPSLGDALEVLDLAVVTFVEDVIVAALTAVMACRRVAERDHGADAIASAVGVRRRWCRVHRVAVVQRNVTR